MRFSFAFFRVDERYAMLRQSTVGPFVLAQVDVPKAEDHASIVMLT